MQKLAPQGVGGNGGDAAGGGRGQPLTFNALWLRTTPPTISTTLSRTRHRGTPRLY